MQNETLIMNCKGMGSTPVWPRQDMVKCMKKPSFYRPSFFLLNHNTKNCHSVDFWGQNWINAFLGKLLHQHPWHTTRLRHLPWTFETIPHELWESFRIFYISLWHLGLILKCPEANASSFFSSVLHSGWHGRGLILSSAACALFWWGFYKKRAPRFKFYKNDLQEWDVSIAHWSKQNMVKRMKNHHFTGLHFFLLNTILKIVILLTFGAKTGSRLFFWENFCNLLHQHPWPSNNPPRVKTQSSDRTGQWTDPKHPMRHCPSTTQESGCEGVGPSWAYRSSEKSMLAKSLMAQSGRAGASFVQRSQVKVRSQGPKRSCQHNKGLDQRDYKQISSHTYLYISIPGIRQSLGPTLPKFLKVLQHQAQALAADQPVQLLPQTSVTVDPLSNPLAW